MNENPASSPQHPNVVMLTWIAETAKAHGFHTMLLVAAVWFFHNENVERKLEIKACNEARFEEQRMQNEAILDALRELTKAIDQKEEETFSRLKKRKT